MRRILGDWRRWRVSADAPRLVLGAGALAIWLLGLPAVARADLWYQHYQKAEEALGDENWSEAIEELNQAIERRGDSGVRVRTYGMRTTDYFPYLKLGIAYFGLGQLKAAVQAFDTEEKLEAIKGSQDGYVQLKRFRGLAQEAIAEAERDERQRIQQILAESVRKARSLAGENELEAAISALDRGLAVAPENPDAQALMSELRGKLRSRQEALQAEQRAGRWLEEGKSLLEDGRYSEASGVLRQALAANPNDPQLLALLDQAQARLAQQVQAAELEQDRLALVEEGLATAERLESAGRIAEALERLQSALAVDPENQAALVLEKRLLEARALEELEASRRVAVDGELAAALGHLEAGRLESSLAAANRALALEPGNERAVELVAGAYAQINEQLLGRGARGNLPPAIRFADFREEQADGSRHQTVRTPSFRLSGLVIDESPVQIAFYGGGGETLEGVSSSQPLGEFHVTEFQLSADLGAGHSTFRLVATDSESLSASSEYWVRYVRPFYRSPWFAVLVTTMVIGSVAGVALQRERQRVRRRRRRFNPYVAGAPVLDDKLFFGREQLIDRILQTIHNNSLLLHGERRIGKTSLQHQLKRRLQELEDSNYEFYPVFIDLQGVPEERFFSTLADEIFLELSPVVSNLRRANKRSEGSQYSYRDFVRDLREVLRRLRQRSSKQVKLVLLIDEVDELNDYDPRVNQRLRSLFMKSFAESLVAVVSGVEIKKEWEREGSPWYNFFEEVELKPLTQEEARALIERPIQGVLKLEKGAIERVIELTGGRPYQIQRLCIALVSRAYEQRTRTIRLADVESVGRSDAV